MAKIDLPKNMTVLKFEQWEKLPKVQEMYTEVEDCDTCYGTGEHKCECGDVHECGACDGKGKEHDLREIYEEELRTEIQHLREWIEGLKTKTPTAENLSRAGRKSHCSFGEQIWLKVLTNQK